MFQTFQGLKNDITSHPYTMKSPVCPFPIRFSLLSPYAKVTSSLLQSSPTDLSSKKHFLVPYFVTNIVPSIRNTFSRNHLQLKYQVTLDSEEKNHSISTYFLKVCHGARNSTMSTESPGGYKTATRMSFSVTVLSLPSTTSINKSVF